MPNTNGSPDRLLIVEDDAAQRTGLQKLLTSWGFTVDIAKDGREALEIVGVSGEDVGSSPLHGVGHDEGIHGMRRAGRCQQSPGCASVNLMRRWY